ncbi:BLUF domain-containing protein [Hyphomonas sp. FCG-A18]|uniref:BLUF domain-containing protein n=1 Tax=Hyphomonas sp. FCG-A18 TaxID=3080019 RepID=UPI002B285F1B|nr:BLUF domain-containing protein [Hyphomonas sp. FCG-A18]
MLYRLVYVSTAREGLTDEEIGAILDVSQSNNHERYLTGFLAHNGRHFMQALEGAREEVDAVFSRILQDDRHFGVVQIVGEQITKRAFPDWAMNYFRADDPAVGTMVVRYNDPIDSLLPKDTPRELLHLFTRFLHIESLTP